MSLRELRVQNDSVIDAVRNPNVDIAQLTKEILQNMESFEFAESIRTNLLQMVGGGHVVLLAGSIGATRGCARLKNDSVSSVPKTLLPLLAPFLFGKCATFNKKGPTVNITNQIKAAQNAKDPYQHVASFATRQADVCHEFFDILTKQSISLSLDAQNEISGRPRRL